MEKRSLTISLVVLALVGSRLLPHPPNWTPILSAGLLGGMFFSSAWLRYGVALGAMAASDIFLGWHGSLPFVYLGVALATGCAWFCRKPMGMGRVAGASFVASCSFFIVSNFGVWAMSSFYPKTLAGLMQCYVAGIPFFGPTVASTILYSCAGYGCVKLLDRTQQLTQQPA